MFVPLAAYAGVTLVSAAFSSDPAASFADCKQLVLFLLVPIVYQFARGSRAASVLQVVISVGAASAAFGIIQYGVLALRQPRPAAPGRARPLHDVLGGADAGHRRGRGPPPVLARARVARADDAGPAGGPGSHLHAQRLGGRVRVDRAALQPEGLPAGRGAPDRRRDLLRAGPGAPDRSLLLDVRSARPDQPRTGRHGPGGHADDRGKPARRRRPQHGRGAAPRLPAADRAAARQSAPAQRADADRGRARPARARHLDLVRPGHRHRFVPPPAHGAASRSFPPPASRPSPPCSRPACSSTTSATRNS